jgi:hypothetical protein
VDLHADDRAVAAKAAARLHLLEEHGYFIAPSVMTPEETMATAEALRTVPLSAAGTRNLLEYPWCRELVHRLRADEPLGAMLPSSLVAVQCTYFDKTGDRNWLVALHQDMSIPVAEPVDHRDLGVWSRKEGQHFVQAPVELLQELVAVRIHLDDCGPDNGPLRVVPGSHRHGRLSEKAARGLRDADGEITCAIPAGGALVMRPLALHASSKASSPRHRRVLHFLFGPASAGFGLRWQHAV